jgi:hypothetical protein
VLQCSLLFERETLNRELSSGHLRLAARPHAEAEVSRSAGNIYRVGVRMHVVRNRYSI